MSLLDKVKALFAEATPETIFVKTVDGQILLVKAPKLDLNVEIVAVDEAGVEQPLKDGDYVLEDNTNLSVLDGKIAEIATAEEEVSDATEDETAAPVDTKMETIPAGDYTLENGDVITIDDKGVVTNWIKAELAPEEPAKDAPIENMEEVVVDKTTELEAKIKELELAIEAKDNEVKVVKEEFNKLKSEPAAKPIDKKKFEKIEKPTQYTMLEKVSMIINKNK